MKYLLLFAFGHFALVSIFAQGYENTMLFGYHGGSVSPNDDGFGLNILQFTEGGLQISDNQTGEAFFNDTDAAISDSSGILQFYFNGIDVFSKNHQVMENGGLLNPFSSTGYDLPQGALIVPFPGRFNEYLLIHEQEGYVAPWGGAGVGLYYSVVDMDKNGGLGAVTLRKQLLVMDTLEYGELAVVRHANGRDWWLIVGEAFKNTFYRILIDNQGLHVLEKQGIGSNREFGLGQACFSPNGRYYATLASTGSNGFYPIFLNIYGFDRCSGRFMTSEQFRIQLVSSIGGGLDFSPDSRWLYVSLNDGLYKYDLESNPVESSQELIAEYEPFSDPFSVKFFWMFRAPDDKIYIVTTSTSRVLHVIHKPDEPGVACEFQQHGIRLICRNGKSLPTFANYRLGPEDGSICDSLGINNNPVSWWRYEQDTLQHARFEFRDLSYHEPAAWWWDFGDGATSTERHPVHEYAGTGAYQVCLTVSNNNGSNTHCKTLYSTVAVRDNPGVVQAIQLGPNPFRNRLAVSLSVGLRSPALYLYDCMGRLLGREPLELGVNEIDTANLPQGMYFWEVEAGGERVKKGKVVKN